MNWLDDIKEPTTGVTTPLITFTTPLVPFNEQRLLALSNVAATQEGLLVQVFAHTAKEFVITDANSEFWRSVPQTIVYMRSRLV